MFKIPNDLVYQMKVDEIDFIHVRDVISVDIKQDGSYSTDWDNFGKPVELKDDYIARISNGLDAWFNSLTSDSSFYKYVEDDYINIHAEDLEDYL